MDGDPIDPTPARKTPLGLEQRLARRLRGSALPADATLVVGFSGGVDSLALAAALVSVRQPARRVVLAHVDHGLRPESAAQALAARDLAVSLGLPFRACRVEDRPQARHPGLGIEEAARRERYLLLATVAREVGTAALVLAHHRDDQAETVLLHLLRGAGTTGAAGMAELTARDVPWWGDAGSRSDRLAIWRPLLTEPRAELAAYVETLGLAPLLDPTNDDPAYRRNLVRHQVLPALERAWPGAAAALARHGALAAEDDALLAGMAARVLADARRSDGIVVLRVAVEPLAIRRRVARAWAAADAPGLEVTAERTEALLRLFGPGRGGRRVEMGQGWTAVARGGIVRLECRADGEVG